MKHINLILLLFIFSGIQGQTNLIVSKKLISDWSEYPVYKHLTEEVSGKTQWKTEFSYLDSIEVYRVTYVSDGLKIKGLMAKPKKAGKYPCIIYNRGGNRDIGSLNVAHGASLLGLIAKEGYIVIASQYRGNAGSEGQEEFGGNDVNDILILPEVLKEIEDADTNRIGMLGWSRGGMMTYLALKNTNKIKAVVVGGAISDLFKTIHERPDMETDVVAELVPNYATNKEEELNDRSAVKWADELPKNVPILMLHGGSDWRVKPEHSLKLALAFEKYRVPYRLIIFEGADHGISEYRQEVNGEVINWFNKYLKNEESLPDAEFHGK